MQIMKQKIIEDEIKQLSNIVNSIYDKQKNCKNGIGKDIFEAHRIITTLVVIDSVGMFTGDTLSNEQRTRLTVLKTKLDTSLNNFDKECIIMRK